MQYTFIEVRYMPTLGEQLKALRVKRGMTQEQLAQKQKVLLLLHAKRLMETSRQNVMWWFLRLIANIHSLMSQQTQL